VVQGIAEVVARYGQAAHEAHVHCHPDLARHTVWHQGRQGAQHIGSQQLAGAELGGGGQLGLGLHLPALDDFGRNAEDFLLHVRERAPTESGDDGEGLADGWVAEGVEARGVDIRLPGLDQHAAIKRERGEAQTSAHLGPVQHEAVDARPVEHRMHHARGQHHAAVLVLVNAELQEGGIPADHLPGHHQGLVEFLDLVTDRIVLAIRQRPLAAVHAEIDARIVAVDVDLALRVLLHAPGDQGIELERFGQSALGHGHVEPLLEHPHQGHADMRMQDVHTRHILLGRGQARANPFIPNQCAAQLGHEHPKQT